MQNTIMKYTSKYNKYAWKYVKKKKKIVITNNYSIVKILGNLNKCIKKIC